MFGKETWSANSSCSPTTTESNASSEIILPFLRSSYREKIPGILIVPTHEESLDDSIATVLRREARERRDERFECAQIANQGVTFKEITIRDYPMIVGDNPSVSSGPPLALDWEFFNETTLSVDVYEESKPVPRNGREMIVPRVRREQIFRDAGYTYNQLIKLTKPVNIARLQRRKTYASIGLSPWLEVYEKATRKAVNVISLGKKKREEKAFLKPWIQQSSFKRHFELSSSNHTCSSVDRSEFEHVPASMVVGN